jgi:hypothetical protein
MNRRKVNLSHFKIFGCKAFMHLTEKNRKKWDTKSREHIFVGYFEETKGYRLIDSKKPMKVTNARDGFIEDTKCDNRNHKEDEGQNTEVELQSLLSEDIHEETSSKADTTTQIVAEEKAEFQEQVREPRYSQRARLSKKYHDGIITYQVTCDQKENPKTVTEALSREDK